MSTGTPFGKYELLHRIARGGMAEVFKAVQHGPNGFERTVALKRILPHLANLPEFLDLFMDEARLAARLSHPNIVHIYEFGRIGEAYFIAMEYVDGIDLTRLFQDEQQDPIPFEHGARIIAEVCGALHYAHGLKGADDHPLNLVHRDISPPNIMVSYSGSVRVLDFGIAKAVHHVDRTQPGLIRGKYTHMAPEQVNGLPIDGRSDLFCAGIVLHELCSGKNLMPRNDPMEAMRMIERAKFPKARRGDSPVPPMLEQILSRSLALRMEDRYSQAADMQLELETFLRSAVQISNSVTLGNYIQHHYPAKDTGPGEQRVQFSVKDSPEFQSIHGVIGEPAKQYNLNDVTLPPFPRQAPHTPLPPPAALDVRGPRGGISPQTTGPHLDVHDPGVEDAFEEDPDLDMLTPIHRGSPPIPSRLPDRDLSVKSTLIRPPSMEDTDQQKEQRMSAHASGIIDQASGIIDQDIELIELEMSDPVLELAEQDLETADNELGIINIELDSADLELETTDVEPEIPRGETAILHALPPPVELPKDRSASERPRWHIFLLFVIIAGVTVAGVFAGIWIARPPTESTAYNPQQSEAPPVAAEDTAAATAGHPDLGAPDQNPPPRADATADQGSPETADQMAPAPSIKLAKKKTRPRRSNKRPPRRIRKKPAPNIIPPVTKITPLRLKLGTLKVNTKPWSKVYLNGKSVGTTPFAKVNLPAGTYRLQLVSGDGQTFTGRITVKPDRVTKVRHTFH